MRIARDPVAVMPGDLDASSVVPDGWPCRRTGRRSGRRTASGPGRYRPRGSRAGRRSIPDIPDLVTLGRVDPGRCRRAESLVLRQADRDAGRGFDIVERDLTTEQQAHPRDRREGRARRRRSATGRARHDGRRRQDGRRGLPERDPQARQTQPDHAGDDRPARAGREAPGRGRGGAGVPRTSTNGGVVARVTPLGRGRRRGDVGRSACRPAGRLGRAWAGRSHWIAPGGPLRGRGRRACAGRSSVRASPLGGECLAQAPEGARRSRFDGVHVGSQGCRRSRSLRSTRTRAPSAFRGHRRGASRVPRAAPTAPRRPSRPARDQGAVRWGARHPRHGGPGPGGDPPIADDCVPRWQRYAGAMGGSATPRESGGGHRMP